MIAAATRWLASERQPMWFLIAVSTAIGAVNSVSLLSWPLIAGTGSFWNFPHGTFPFSFFDSAAITVGYQYFVHPPCRVPLLEAPFLDGGTNIFWLDAGPWLVLIGKAIFTATGHVVNVYGPYLFFCFALPGVAMTALLTAAGHRNLLGAVTGSVFADATPYLLYRWGHVVLCGQFFLLVALALYARDRGLTPNWRTAATWIVFLALLLLTNIYLLTMSAGIWLAEIAQQRIDGRRTTARVIAEIAACGLVLAVLLSAMVPLGGGVATARTHDFGHYQIDLLSPAWPQTSGRVPPPHNVAWLSPEGFAYLGAGVLVLLVLTLGTWRGDIRRLVARHAVLLAVFALFVVFALSTNVVAGGVRIVAIPLPAAVEQAFGMFRSTGRFFWPIGYALVAVLILQTLRRRQPWQACAILAAASILQWIDTMPLRAAVRQSAEAPLSPVLDRAEAARYVASSARVVVVPNFDCVMTDAALPWPERFFGGQVNMEMQLAAARADVPIDLSYHARGGKGCAEFERRCRRADLVRYALRLCRRARNRRARRRRVAIVVRNRGSRTHQRQAGRRLVL